MVSPDPQMSISQTWHPETYARNARFVSDLGSPVVELLAPQPGERILDLAQLDSEPTDFHLPIDTTEKLYIPVRQLACEVARSV